ncbi:hypothetical protein BHF68_10270 [Desulfuribacillus alkaliarsenatis]|uniref:HTH cro/C1-type domain-containing protein n=1 Tax=Desulfuribacillus alkaliarsenatis TaxID=766136 RepID=A0A1E5G018_9FIRM|nr:hypothetical protein BHF68_10270 [Desulfuribacillus alkaliarsenatis]
MALNLSYQDLAEKTGISKSTLQRYETGAIKSLGVDKLEILAEALKTTPAYLMGWVQEPKSLAKNTFTSAKEAMEFILSTPVLMRYGGYDVNNMSNEQVVEFANELLHHLELVSYKYKSRR